MSNKFSKEPSVHVGIMETKELRFTLFGQFRLQDSLVEGPQTATVAPDGSVMWNGDKYAEIIFEATSPECVFELEDVVIGVNFHWERKENQRFKGDLKLIGGKTVTAIDIVPVEDYLASVISSEMSATASLELLKAHAVISRSWLLAQLDKRGAKAAPSKTETDTERIVWYDRDNHDQFDVCADDHCQRYQGITRQTTPTVDQAVEATRGLVLTNKDGGLCDARFSKCCGGVFEEFENCWEPVHHHYLEVRRDSPAPNDYPDLTKEENARQWILSAPEAFCNTTDSVILGQVLNNYDQETNDFYRWTVKYSQNEIAELIKNRSGIDFGAIFALEPVERGTSGRLIRMRIVGSKKILVIGKELEIRRTLSTSHLFSSAFVVEAGEAGADGAPVSFTLRGAGWGHGVGLCQIGAAVMGAKGYPYTDILSHYFPGANLTTLY